MQQCCPEGFLLISKTYLHQDAEIQNHIFKDSKNILCAMSDVCHSVLYTEDYIHVKIGKMEISI